MRLRIDMTSGSPLRGMLRFSAPMLAGSVLMQLSNLLDSLIVGRAAGVEAFAAIAAAAPVAFLATGFLMGFCNGFLLPIALAVGAGDKDAADRYACSALMLATLMSVAVAIPAAALSDQMIALAGTPADIAPGARFYLRVAMLSTPIPLISMALSGLMRAEGDTRTPLKFHVLEMVLHLGLNLLLIVGLRMGVAGAAYASLMAHAAACALYARRVLSGHPGILRYFKFGVRPDMAKKLLLLGAPIGLTNLLAATGAAAFQMAVNSLGSAAVAAVAVAERLYALVAMPAMMMGGVMEVFSGQNYGANRMGRIRDGTARLYVLTAATLAPAALLLALGSGRLVPLWLGDAAAPALIGMAGTYLYWCALAAPFQCANSILKNVLQGIGMPGKAVIASVYDLLARLACVLFAAKVFGFVAVCAANFGGAALSALALVVRCRAVSARIEGKEVAISAARTNACQRAES